LRECVMGNGEADGEKKHSCGGNGTHENSEPSIHRGFQCISL
jgi:hypothetical protein